MNSLSQYRVLADLFDYPKSDYFTKVSQVLSYLKHDDPKAHELLEPFEQQILRMELKDIEELYTRTFDVQSATTLDIGYVLFGDDYKRGEILSHLNREHRSHENPCGQELADHLPNVLRLLPKLQDQELLHELVEEILAPALEKMISEFDPKRLVIKEQLYQKHYKTLIESKSEWATIYSCALKTLYHILKKDFSFSVKTLSRPSADFLTSLGTEIEIEDERA